jgi:hypothetical protein
MNRIFLVGARLWLATFILLAGTQPGTTQTWIQWRSDVGGNSHFYALTPWATNWAAAQALAVSWGGTLATITSPGEQDFINRTFLTGRFEHLPVWIGLVWTSTNVTVMRIRRAMEDLGLLSTGAVPFKWVTGEPLSYSNWHPGQPDNFPPGENYVAMNWHYSDSPPRGVKGDWNDAPLNGTTNFGGATDGPYFGLVERETDPTRPRGSGGLMARPGLITMLILALLLGLALLRRNKIRS